MVVATAVSPTAVGFLKVLLRSSAMDVGITKSNKSHPVHFISGLFVIMIGFTAMMFAIRPYVASNADGLSSPRQPMQATVDVSTQSQDVVDRVAAGLL
jgi:hypothetical protein